ncbi:MAG: DNA (cytosine-5-)-methyltransferase [Methanomethylophilus sp.]
MAENIRVVELFAGVGGFRVGLERASDRFVTVWANQWEPGKKDQFAFKCYDAHFRGTGSVNVNEDIGIAKADVPDHDLLVGGFPCQDYSVASTKARGIEGKKGVLWWYIHDILKRKQPKYVILENVDRLVRSPVRQRGRDFGIILRCLADDGYCVEWRIVNAADYGLQQRRRRTFIFACRKDLPMAEVYRNNAMEKVVNEQGFFARTFPVKDELIKDKINTFSISKRDYHSLVEVSDSFEEHFYKAGVMVGYKVYTRDIVPIAPDKVATLGGLLQTEVNEKYYVTDLDQWKVMKGAKHLPRTRKDGSKYCYTEGAIPFPDILERPGRTMLTSEGTPNRSSHLVLDPMTGRYRTITPVECERLNGFPDDWTNTGMTERQRYFTMGNALVVQLIERMGRTLAEIDAGQVSPAVRSVPADHVQTSLDGL